MHIAYQIVGDGPVDLIYTPGIWSNLEIMWEWPEWARYLNRLASFARLVLFDMRGVGLSDRGIDPPALELQVDDIGAVMDAAHSETGVLFGGARGGAMTMLFAASFPERTRALVLYAPNARTLRAPDWPFGRTPEEQELFYARFSAEMGTAKNLDIQGPSGDERFKRWWARFERLGASPGAWREIAEILAEIDVRQVLPNIRVPTLVLHRTGDRIIDVGQAREIARRIPAATFVELPGDDHIPFLGDPDSIVDEIEAFVTGVRPVPDADRVLATVLFTDIVASTERAVAMGDHAWRRLLDSHDHIVRGHIDRLRGRCIKTTGDGVLATFDGPGRAIRCAQSIRDDVRSLGIEVRAGLHCGEVELRGDDVGGVAVHIGARIAALAGAGCVMVSSTVRDLVAGSGVTLIDVGEHDLKGVPGTWRLFEVSAP